MSLNNMEISNVIIALQERVTKLDNLWEEIDVTVKMHNIDVAKLIDNRLICRSLIERFTNGEI